MRKNTNDTTTARAATVRNTSELSEAAKLQQPQPELNPPERDKDVPWAFCPDCSKEFDKCECEPLPKGWYPEVLAEPEERQLKAPELIYVYFDGEEFSRFRVYWANNAKWRVYPDPRLRHIAEFEDMTDAEDWAEGELLYDGHVHRKVS